MLYVGLAVAAVTDIGTKRIPNWLTFSLVALGLVIHATLPGGLGIGAALLGAAAAFALHFPIWASGLEGAGDAKLMMAVGAFLGWELMIEATLWRYVLLLPYAVAAITALGRWGNFRAAVHWTLAKAQGAPVGERPAPTLLPFGPLIAIAVPCAVHTDWLAFF